LTAAVAFALEIVRDYFSDSQTMEYIQSHHPRLYAFLSPLHVGVSAVTGFFLVLLLIGDRLVSRRTTNKALETKQEQASQSHAQTATSAQQVEPRIVFLTAKTVSITVGEHTLYECNSGQGDLGGVKACFRNQADFGRAARDVLGVRANLRFMDKDGVEIGEGVSGVAWLGQSGDVVNIPKDETRCVCVLMMIRGTNPKLLVPSKKRVPIPGSRRRLGLVDVPVELSQAPHTVEVRLTGSNGLILPPVLIDIALENGTLTAKPWAEVAAH
jgi:hypothetical protein